MIGITDFSSHIIWLEKKFDKTGGHQTSQERLFYFCAQPTRLSWEVLFPTSTPFLEPLQTHHVSQVFFSFFFFFYPRIWDQTGTSAVYIYTTIALPNDPTSSLNANYLLTLSMGGGFSHALGVCMAYREDSPRFFWPNYTHTSPIMLMANRLYILFVSRFSTYMVQKNFVPHLGKVPLFAWLITK